MEHRHLESRVSSLETSVEALTRDVTELARTVQDQGDNLRREFQLLSEKLSGIGRPNWQVMLTAVMLILAVGGAALSPIWLHISHIEKRADILTTQLEAHRQLKLHPVGETRIDHLEAAFLERAGRNRDDIRDLDTKLQTETHLISERLQQEVKALADQFNEVKRDGSPITRERLAILEHFMKELKK